MPIEIEDSDQNMLNDIDMDLEDNWLIHSFNKFQLIILIYNSNYLYPNSFIYYNI